MGLSFMRSNGGFGSNVLARDAGLPQPQKNARDPCFNYGSKLGS